MNDDERYVCCVGGDSYAFNLEKLKDFCLMSDRGESREQETIENFENDPNLNMMEKVSIISREVKTSGNPQNDTIVYDMIKLFLSVMLESDMPSVSEYSDMNFSTAISFNTLLKEGIIYKVDEKK